MCLGTESCLPCPSNTYNPFWGRTVCGKCFKNSVSFPASTVCTCPSGWILAGVFGNYSCQICPQNTFTNTLNGIVCHVCPGVSSATPGSTSCSGYQINSPWPGLGRFPNTRASPSLFSSGASKMKSLWAYQTGGNIGYASPVIAADGTVYVGSSDGGLYALTGRGLLKWVYFASLSLSSQSAAIAADGDIYIYGNDNYLYCINSAGALQWYKQLGDCCNYGCGSGCDTGTNVPYWRLSKPSPTIGPDGSIYLAAYSPNTLFGVNPNSSTTFALTMSLLQPSTALLVNNNPGWSRGTVAFFNGTLIVSSKPWLLAYSAKSRNLVWVRNLHAPLSLSILTLILYLEIPLAGLLVPSGR